MPKNEIPLIVQQMCKISKNLAIVDTSMTFGAQLVQVFKKKFGYRGIAKLWNNQHLLNKASSIDTQMVHS